MKASLLLFFTSVLPFLGLAQTKSLQKPSDKQLEQLYHRAIKDFITVVKKEKQPRFDTLYFGTHIDNLPGNISTVPLPKIINACAIVRIKGKESASLLNNSSPWVYINLPVFEHGAETEFRFVVFSNGFKHQYDCSIVYLAANKNFTLKSIKFYAPGQQ